MKNGVKIYKQQVVMMAHVWYTKQVHKNKINKFLHPTLKLMNQRPFSIGTYSCNALLVTLPKSCFYST